MKKLFFLGLISIGTVAFAQDFSWGISTYAGLTKVNTTTDNISPIEIGRDRSLNLSTYMDYRLAGPFHLKAELFTQSARQLSLYNYFASTTYYFPSFSNYYDANCIINFQEINKNRSFGLAVLLGLKFGQFDIYGGLALNLLNRQELKLGDNLGIDHDVYDSYPDAYAIYSDNTILEQNLANAQMELNLFGYGVIFNSVNTIFGFQYHLNAFNIGYRRSYGFNQLTVGYDIGRYRYE